MDLYLIKLAGILLFAVGLTTIERTIFHRLYPKVKSSPRLWDDALAHALHLPVLLYIWISAVTSAATVLDQTFLKDQSIIADIQVFHKISAFLLIMWTFIRFISKFENKSTTLRTLKHDPTTVQRISQILKAIVVLFGSLGIMQFLGVPLSGVIAFGGVGGVAVGFAAKDLFANFFGGLIIFVDRPFLVGDWIRSPDKEIEGTVEHIGWRHTRIRTFDKRPLFIPNSIFSTISVENPSRMSNRRIRANISLSYEDSSKVTLILSQIDQLLKTHHGIDQSSYSFANLTSFGPHSLEVTICAFTKATDLLGYQAVQQDVLLKALDLVHSHGAKIAYPVRSLRITNGNIYSDIAEEEPQK
ncbi:MAG: mechanosensitive ion channel protein MscS [Chlamydiae bacterium CG10_big_fil_rev_8_21_14_0_10_42_34]|nr:MAG: mechanosensitive ion channel protein MscS [Chlamydiae bacterium CG10_big_fil_rev_8_21_14_0_10_42_34]